jgi:predicted transcriptional regulator
MSQFKNGPVLRGLILSKLEDKNYKSIYELERSTKMGDKALRAHLKILLNENRIISKEFPSIKKGHCCVCYRRATKCLN